MYAPPFIIRKFVFLKQNGELRIIILKKYWEANDHRRIVGA